MEHLARLLLDFGSAPGKYLVRLREPRALFDEFDVIAQWALDRLPESLQDRATDLKAAAVLFIQRACFAPDNTYYQVLGLRPQAYPPDELRARYRTMIRLAHPDMGVKGLPASAASLVNRANAVLSDAAQRRLYDEQLARAQGPQQPCGPGRVQPMGHPPAPAARRVVWCLQHPRAARPWLHAQTKQTVPRYEPVSGESQGLNSHRCPGRSALAQVPRRQAGSAGSQCPCSPACWLRP